MVTFGSLFSGIGGLDLGLERAGLECRFQVEIDPFCNKVLEKHWPHVKRYGDITKITGEELERVDLICGGFPCQDLSQAGKRAGIEGTRSGLWFEYARIIGELRPRFVLIENVSGLLANDAMRRVVGELARLRYVGLWLSLRASDFGASHLRKRVFLVAYSTDHRYSVRAIGDRKDPIQQGRQEVRSKPVRFQRDMAHTNGRQRQQCGWSESNQRDVERRLFGSDCSRGTLGDTASPRRSWSEDAGTDSGDAGEERSRGQEPERRRCDVADASDGQLQEPWWGSEGREGVGPTSQILSDAGESGLPDPEQEAIQRTGRRIEGGTVTELRGAFAPGPSDSRWGAILAERPDLAPSLESPVRGMAHGLPDWLDRAMSNRTKRLSRLGNAVVPQIAEWLGRQIVEAFESENLTGSLDRW